MTLETLETGRADVIHKIQFKRKAIERLDADIDKLDDAIRGLNLYLEKCEPIQQDTAS